MTSPIYYEDRCGSEELLLSEEDEPEKLGSGTIFLIDTGRDMFKENVSGETFVTSALRCCIRTFMAKVNENSNDHYGVIFCGTKGESFPDDMYEPGSYFYVKIFTPLAKPCVKSINELESIKMVSETVFEKKRGFGFSDKFCLHEALKLCWDTFHYKEDIDDKYHTKHVILFTCNDNPYPNEPHQREMALDRAGCLQFHGITLQLIQMGFTFDLEPFYQELLDIANRNYAEIPNPGCANSLKELINQVQTRNLFKVPFCVINWDLGQKYSINVSLYKLYRRKIHPVVKRSDVWDEEEYLYTENGNLVLLPNTVFNLSRGSAELLKIKQEKYEKCVADGCRTVDTQYCRTKENMKLHMMTKLGIDLVGFVSSRKINLLHPFKPFNFLNKDELELQLESGYSKNKWLFVALLEKCLEFKKLIVCYIPTSRKTSEIIYLKPQRQTIDSCNGTVICPYGFHLFYPDEGKSYINRLENPQVIVNLAENEISFAHNKYKPDEICWTTCSGTSEELKAIVTKVEDICDI